MHAARVDRSARLRRVHEVLSDGREHSTMEIVRWARVCAVNSIVSELRHGGAEIACRVEVSERGDRVWLYRMTTPARGMEELAPGRLPFGGRGAR